MDEQLEQGIDTADVNVYSPPQSNLGTIVKPKKIVPLWLAFFVYFLIGGYAIGWISNVLLTIIADPRILHSLGFNTQHPAMWLITYALINAAYMLWAWIKVWESAPHVKRKAWGYAARILSSALALYSYYFVLQSIYFGFTVL